MAHQSKAADLAVVPLDGRVSADKYHEEEVDLFARPGTGIAEGSSVSSCDFSFGDTGDDSGS